MKSNNTLGCSLTFGHFCSNTWLKYLRLKPPVHHTVLCALSVCVIMRVALGTGRFMAHEVISERMRTGCVLTAVPLTHAITLHFIAVLPIYFTGPVISYLHLPVDQYTLTSVHFNRNIHPIHSCSYLISKS